MKAALRYCATPHCPQKVRHGHCPAHTTAREQHRGSAHQRGYTSRWARYSKRRLLDHPLCVGYPHGVHATPTLAAMTDHIVSAKDRPDLFWDQTNHQSLCATCNTRKALDLEGGFGR